MVLAMPMIPPPIVSPGCPDFLSSFLPLVTFMVRLAGTAHAVVSNAEYRKSGAIDCVLTGVITFRRSSESSVAYCETGSRQSLYGCADWDYDLATAPRLLTVKHDGKMVDIVAEAGKNGFFICFRPGDRQTDLAN